MPRIEVPAEHHDFVRLVGARDFGDGVVRRLAVRIDAVQDVELERDRRAVSQNARDPAVVFVAQDDRRQGLRQVVRRAAERADLAVFAPASLTRSSAPLATRNSLIPRVTSPAVIRAGSRVGTSPQRASPQPAAHWDQTASAPLVVAPLRVRARGRRRAGTLPPTSTIGPLTWLLDGIEMLRQVGRRQPFGHNQMEGRGLHGALCSRRPGQHFDNELILNGRDDSRGDALVHPARMLEIPRLEASVRRSASATWGARRSATNWTARQPSSRAS